MDSCCLSSSTIIDADDAGSSTSNDDRSPASSLYINSLPPRKRSRNYANAHKSDITSNESNAFEANLDNLEGLNKQFYANAKSLKYKKIGSGFFNSSDMNDGSGYFQTNVSQGLDVGIYKGNPSANLFLLSDHIAKQLNLQHQFSAFPKPSPQSSDCKSTVSVVGVEVPKMEPLLNLTQNAPCHNTRVHHPSESTGKNLQDKSLPFACSLCLKRFTTAQALGGHQNAHKHDSVFSLVKPGKSLRNLKPAKAQNQVTGKRRHFSLVPRFDSTRGIHFDTENTRPLENLNPQIDRASSTPFLNFNGGETSTKVIENVQTSMHEKSLPSPCCNWHCNYFSVPCKQRSNAWGLEHEPKLSKAKDDVPVKTTLNDMNQIELVEKDLVANFSALETKHGLNLGGVDLDLDLRL